MRLRIRPLISNALAHNKVNMVNTRREFFYATPGEVRDLLAQYQGDLLSFTEAGEALEWRQSCTARDQLEAAGLQH